MKKKSFDETWEQIHKTQDWGQYPSEDVIRFVARNYYHCDRNQINILDFGCGAGANTWYLAKERFNTYAFDGSASAVQKAEKRLTAENLSASFRVADALNTGYDDYSFDCIIDSAVISANTTEDINSLYQEVYRMLKIGGKIFSTGLFTIGTSGYDSGTFIESNTYKDLKDGALSSRGTVHFFSCKDEIENILTNCNFHDISIDKVTRSDHNGNDISEYYLVSATK